MELKSSFQQFQNENLNRVGLTGTVRVTLCLESCYDKTNSQSYLLACLSLMDIVINMSFISAIHPA